MTESNDLCQPRTAIAGFVLAGGQSRRMGRDKADLPFKSGSLLSHQVALLETVASPVMVSGSRWLPDRIPGIGPVGGILTCLYQTSVPWNLFLAVDLPRLTPEFLRYFAERAIRSSRQVVVCDVDDRFPLCLGLNRTSLDPIHAYVNRGGRSIRELVHSLPSEIIQIAEVEAAGFDRGLFHNLNSLDDYLHA